MSENKRLTRKMTLTQEQVDKRVKSALKRKIRNIFTVTGFTYVPTNDHEMSIGLRKVEVDALFIYENIWLLCEDTIKTTDIRDHIRIKNEAFGEIKRNLSAFRSRLVELFPDKDDLINKYDVGRIKVYGLYVSKEYVPLSENDYKLFSNLTFVQPKTLNYFQWISQCIKRSAKTEIFRFLNITNSDIGNISSSSEDTKITAPIIYPKSFTGLKNGIRVVSFMMSAEDLLNTCYVLRKDNWTESIWLYQRLIEKEKIKSIRNFLESNGEAFYNNIIVALPDSVAFYDEANHYKTIEEIGELESNCQLVLPKEMNSICVIDGQHRIFAHYESGIQSKQERKIAVLREQLHLLVTGLVFPTGMSSEERARIQSKIFLEINSNAKPVPPNVLLQIKRISNPIADESIAQFVIEQLNKQGIFQNLLQISTLDNGKIKTASIVKFALKYLVTVAPTEGKESLFKYWDGDKEAFLSKNGDAIEEYVKFCTTTLRNYFGAIKKNLSKQWDDNDSKLLSVISINGFIIALTRQLRINGVRNFEFYDSIFSKWTFDFSKAGFQYTSSQYRKFSTQILLDAFGIPEEVVVTL